MQILREWMQRLLGTLGPGRRDRDLEEELRLHLELAAADAKRRGEAPQDAARAARVRTGSVAQAMDALRDQRGLPWLDALASDLVFGWRQLNKHRVASGAAILSLGLAIGATTAAFRLVDAVLLRPLPVVEPERLLYVATTFIDQQNRPDYRDDFDYPTFRRYVNAVGDRADLMVVGMIAPQEITVGAADEPEKIYRQFVSGNVFATFGLQPALGRLLGPSDDVMPGGHPVAVISYHYWSRRFGRNPDVIGTTFRMANQQYEIVGIAQKDYIGTEPGRVADLFIPAMMNVEAINSPGWSWFRLWVRPKPGVPSEQVRQILQTAFDDEHRQTVKSFPSDTPQQRIDAYLSEQVLLRPAGAGTSEMQKNFRRPLVILAALVTLILLIACMNVANLLIAQAMARGREMALRVSIGAGRSRLVRLVLVESALLAFFASAVGALFASWSAPFVVSMLAPPDDPVRLILDTDWRAIAFGVALAFSVTVLFGIAPAIRVSSVDPVSALKGGEHPPAQRRLTNSLIAAQMAFCVFVLFVAVLFVSTFTRLSNQPVGFSQHDVLVIETELRRKAQPPEIWTQVVDQLRQTPGVESAAVSSWALLSENRWSGVVRVAGRPLDSRPAYFLSISPAFFATLRIGMIDGRDFRPGDTPPKLDVKKQPAAGVGIVNEAFARVYFDGQNPVGKQVSVRPRNDQYIPMEIVGLVRDAAYFNVREPMRPTVFMPVEQRGTAALLVRTAGDPLALAPALRREISRAHPDFRVHTMAQHSALVDRQMLRERLLATLSVFFAVVALLLAGIGLYGVLNYAVIQQRREIGVRMALGARAADVVRCITGALLVMVSVGLLIGLAGGLAFGRLVEPLLFRVKATDPSTFLTPILILAAVAAFAAIAPALRAVRIDPAQTLRTE